VTIFSGSDKRVAIKFMIFQQHPKQEIARIVPLIGDCRVGRGRAFSSNFYRPLSHAFAL
jgi:hypothetical protein